MFTIQLLNSIRAAELEVAVAYFPQHARILEIGAGTGSQAAEIARRGFKVEAIELADSNYRNDRVFPIIDYDGVHIPFPDRTFDIVFSSNVLEHVPHLSTLHAEIKRVLRDGGRCVHILPTHRWRLWTTLSAFPTAFQHLRILAPELLPRARLTWGEVRRLGSAWLRLARTLFGPLCPRRHGERGTWLSELWLFRPGWWRSHFLRNGFDIVAERPMGLHYTGNLMFGEARSIEARRRMAQRWGSACHLFQLQLRRDRASS